MKYTVNDKRWKYIFSICHQRCQRPKGWVSAMMTSSNGKKITALLPLCEGNPPVNGAFPSQRPVTRRFDVFFDLRLNKRLSKQSWGWWFETPSYPLWRHCNGTYHLHQIYYTTTQPDHFVEPKFQILKNKNSGIKNTSRTDICVWSNSIISPIEYSV